MATRGSFSCVTIAEAATPQPNIGGQATQNRASIDRTGLSFLSSSPPPHIMAVTGPPHNVLMRT